MKKLEEQEHLEVEVSTLLEILAILLVEVALEETFVFQPFLRFWAEKSALHV